MTDPQHPEGDQPRPTEQFASAEPPQQTATTTEEPARRGRKRIALVAAVAVAVLAVGGGGGFAVGRATAPDPVGTTVSDERGFPGDGDGGPMGGRPGQDSSTDEPTA